MDVWLHTHSSYHSLIHLSIHHLVTHSASRIIYALLCFIHPYLHLFYSSIPSFSIFIQSSFTRLFMRSFTGVYVFHLFENIEYWLTGEKIWLLCIEKKKNGRRGEKKGKFSLFLMEKIWMIFGKRGWGSIILFWANIHKHICSLIDWLIDWLLSGVKVRRLDDEGVSVPVYPTKVSLKAEYNPTVRFRHW